MRMLLNRSLSSSNKGLLGHKESQKENTKRIRHKENTNTRCGQTWPLTEPGDKQSCTVHLWRKASMDKNHNLDSAISKSCELPALF